MMKSPFSMTRRDALKLLAYAAPALWLSRGRGAETEMPKILSGPFAGNGESLRAYRCPDWFRDAKLGMWAHWGPQSAPEDGDWYARNLYLQGTKQYKSHLERYGHPTKFGYKDIIPTWKGEQFDPDHLVGLYKKAGAKYFMSMGVHVDNFDMWNSKFQRWNAAKMGVKRNVVGEFRRAARRNSPTTSRLTPVFTAFHRWNFESHMSKLSTCTPMLMKYFAPAFL